MSTIRAVLTIFSLAFWLAGCASLSEGECRSGNWYEIGRADGARGLQMRAVDSHREACAKFGVRPDYPRYRRDREQGLLSYCTPSNGYQEGRHGYSYGRVCPAHLEPGFLRNYRFAYKIYDLERELSDVSGEIVSIKDRLEDGKLEPKKRKKLRRALRELREDKHDLQHRIDALEAVGILLN